MLQHILLTTNGVTGACNAAILLMAHPEAGIRITSPRHVATALRDAGEDLAPGGTIHVCGVDATLPPRDLRAALEVAAARGSVRWYAGTDCAGVQALAKPPIPGVALVLDRRRDTVDLLRKRLGIGNTAQASLVSTLHEACRDGGPPREERWRRLHDLVLAANRQFYFFGDDRLNHEVFRHLAGLLPLSAAMEAALARYRDSDDAIWPLGASAAMRKIRQLVGKIGPIDEPVLIQGPTGSGKEVVARALHVTSGRQGAFVAVNCAVLGGNPAMLEDRLFGHVRGAFTGADKAAKGAFEEADGGTLFLDEIGELPGEAQSQLLRVLEERRVRPLGTMETRRVNARVVAATHRDLRRMVAGGQFREDLYYRLEILQIHVPPLRDRPEDIRSIVAAECDVLCARGYPLQPGTADWRAIDAHPWPGNVRELKNVLRRAAYLGMSIAQVLEESSDTGKDSPDGPMVSGLPTTTGEVAALDAICKAYVQRVVSLFEGNITQSARALGIAPNTVRKHLNAGDSTHGQQDK